MLKAFGLFLCLFTVALAKFKSLHCQDYDKSLVQCDLCQIKAVSRTKNLINIMFTLYKNVNLTMVRIQIFKRANGWRPFLYDIKFEGCQFMRKSNNIIASIAYGYLKQYTNLNHTCPYKTGERIHVRNFDLDVDNLRQRFPIDNGEYALQVSFYIEKKLKLTINGSIYYFNYKEQ